MQLVTGGYVIAQAAPIATVVIELAGREFLVHNHGLFRQPCADGRRIADRVGRIAGIFGTRRPAREHLIHLVIFQFVELPGHRLFFAGQPRRTNAIVRRGGAPPVG